MKILVTGAAGFIGMHVSINLIKQGYKVIGLDNFNEYYDKNLKFNRIKNIKNYSKNFECLQADLENFKIIREFF